ncbi:MAG: ribosome-associated translation inhibitor RaiA [Kistimonas sp.]|nr:ribosome-associated translation inhibitor RaiA [Kistimonas sp.]
MQLRISGHQFSITESLHQYVTRKLSKLPTYCEGIVSIQVTLSVNKQRHKAEAVLHMRSAEIAASAEDDDMYKGIDVLADRLHKQLVKQKEKTVNRSQGSGS